MAYIAFGCIISVQLSDFCDGSMFCYIDVVGLPALPLPVVAVTSYAIAINVTNEYSNVSCND